MRRADARFVLPRHPATATVVGDDRGWSEALASAGIREVDGSAGPDLVVSDARRAQEALAVGAPMVLVEGPTSRRRARAAGYEVTRYLVLPDVDHPEMVIPTVHRYARRRALAYRGGRKSPLRLLQYRLTALGAIAAPRRVWPTSQLMLASREGDLPAALAAATPLGAPADPSWYLMLGSHTSLPDARLAFLAGPRRGSITTAVKVSRVRGAIDRFERDQAGTALLAAAAPGLTAAAPRLLGQTTTAEHALSVETAAVGPRLVDTLRRRGTDAVPIVEPIAQWLTDLAVESRLEPGSLIAARGQLESTLAPWRGEFDIAALIDDLRDVVAVLAHGDAGAWNIICVDGGFQIMDWETATRAAPPMADLLFFLGNACTTMIGRPNNPEELAALFSGHAELSPVVFRHVRAATEALALSTAEVGGLATLTWLTRGAIALAQYGDDHGMVRFARRWMADPLLGPGWSAWAPVSRG